VRRFLLALGWLKRLSIFTIDDFAVDFRILHHLLVESGPGVLLVAMRLCTTIIAWLLLHVVVESSGYRFEYMFVVGAPLLGG
jgi:hypothetical protein